MNSLLALALSFHCTGYGMIEVGIQGQAEPTKAKNVIVWLTDVACPVEESHIEKYEYSDEHILIHIRNPENSEEFFQFDTQGSSGQVTFHYKGARMNQQKVYCTYQ